MSIASILVLPIHRPTRVALERGEGRIPVDHRVGGQRVKYWRELRNSKTTKWDTFPHFPVVLNADGSPWVPGYLWLLDRARTKPLKTSTLRPLAEALRDYKVWLDEEELAWDDFSAADKLLRPTYLYRAHLNDLINRGVIQSSTAARRMSVVIQLYRWVSENQNLLECHLQNAPCIEREIGLELRDSKGFKQVLPVTTTDISIKVPRRDYAWDKTINDGGKLLPLSHKEQKVLVSALKELGNREFELMHYLSLLTGARIQTVLTLRWGSFARPPDQINHWPMKLQCGPGTGVDTKGDVANVYLSVPRQLYEWLHLYATSPRSAKRREKSLLKQAPINYLFVSNQGGPYYESKDDINAIRDYVEPLKRSSPTGQNLRAFIKEKVIPLMQKTLPGFEYRFHDLRATFGTNWIDTVTKGGDTRERYIWCREQLRKLMWHKQATTTDGYIEYRQHIHMLETALEGWNTTLLDLIASAGEKYA